MKIILPHRFLFIVFTILWPLFLAVHIRCDTTIPANTVNLIATTFGKKPDIFPDSNSVRISIPRNEVPITLKGRPIHPFMGATTHLFFQKGSKPTVEIMAMADLVLFEEEINIAIKTALEEGITIGALHNHFLYEQPRFYFIHLELEGGTNEVIFKLKKLIQAIKETPPPRSGQPSTATPKSSLDASYLKSILGDPTESQDGMQKYLFGRSFQAKCKCFIDKGMGVGSWIAFQGDNSSALAVGDFALQEQEVQLVLEQIRIDNILQVTSIGNHVLEESPRMISVHFIAGGPTNQIATAFAKALLKTKTDLSQLKTTPPKNPYQRPRK